MCRGSEAAAAALVTTSPARPRKRDAGTCTKEDDGSCYFAIALLSHTAKFYDLPLRKAGNVAKVRGSATSKLLELDIRLDRF